MNTRKPKRGRPLESPGGSSEWLRIRLPAAELKAIDAAARAARKSRTAYVRERLR
jgi:uncharacterized protein (DUF1778 family)